MSLALIGADEQCTTPGLRVTPWMGSFGATVSTSMQEVLVNPCLQDEVRQAFAEFRLLSWDVSLTHELRHCRLSKHFGGCRHRPSWTR